MIKRLCGGIVKSQWKFLLVSVPAAVVTSCCVVWMLYKKGKRTENSVSIRNSDPESFAFEDGAMDEEQPLVSGNSMFAPAIDNCQSLCTSSGKSFPSPSDSGFREPSSPEKIKCEDTELPVTSTPHLLPTAPDSVVSISPTIDTTIIRGGRARATVQLPIDIIGRFIGRLGKNIKSLMAHSGAQIHVQQKNLSRNATVVPCVLQGTQAQINKAIDLICLRHPEVSLPGPHMFHPPLSIYSNSNSGAVASWDYALKPLQSPTSVFLAIVTYIEKLNRVWLVQYSSTQLIEDLHQSMANAYRTDDADSSTYEEEIVGKYCAVRVNEIYWLRGKVVSKNEESHHEVRLMDYGSSVIVPFSSLKPLRKEHTQIPIQSLPFQLSNIQPVSSDGEDGMLVLQALVEGAVLEAHPMGNMSSDDQTPFLELYTQPHESNGQTFINRELVNQGFAIWQEVVAPESPSLSSSLSPLTCTSNINDTSSALAPSSDVPTTITDSVNSVSSLIPDKNNQQSLIFLPRAITLSELLSSKPLPSCAPGDCMTEDPACLLAAASVTSESTTPPVSHHVDPIKALFGDQLHRLIQPTSS